MKRSDWKLEGPMVSCGKRSINRDDSGAGEDFKGGLEAAGDQQLNHGIQGGPGEEALQASDPINLISHASSRLLWLLGNSLSCVPTARVPLNTQTAAAVPNPHLLLSFFFLLSITNDRLPADRCP